MEYRRPAVIPSLVAQSDLMQAILQTAKRVAAGTCKVLITGESGVGKDLLARFVHAHSARASRPFLAINCAGMAETLLESELFGHVRGSFTDAHRDKIGKLELADRGSFFLDEVGEMTPRMQALLLRFLENGEIQPVGADTPARHVDVRVIAATNRDLRRCVKEGTFREDLLYRLEVVHLHIPPLRDRKEDLRMLIDHLALEHDPALTIPDDAMNAMLQYGWPGNVRELQNVMEQLAVMATDDAAAVMLLPTLQAISRSASPQGGGPRPQAMDELFHAIVSGRLDFWTSVYEPFLSRDMTRSELRDLIRRGLVETHGNYRELLRLFRLPARDYKRLMNFLAAHDCSVDYREFRASARGLGEWRTRHGISRSNVASWVMFLGLSGLAAVA